MNEWLCARCIVEHHRADIPAHKLETAPGMVDLCRTCRAAVTILDGAAICGRHLIADLPASVRR